MCRFTEDLRRCKMQSIYSRLFRYKARSDREPLEDFLSEALADLLSRMTTAEIQKILSWAFETAQDKPDWKWLDAQPLQWVTQVQVPGGIADIVLFAGSRPVLVIENKTWSGYQDHSTDHERATQVTTYCKWLKSGATKAGPCAILLITGTTESPEGYHGNGNFAVSARSQVTWAAMGRWLQSAIQPSQSEPKTWQTLAADLIEFLKDKKLNSEVFTSADVSAASLMMPTMERWRSSFSTMWSGADEVCRRFLKARTSDLLFQTEGGMLWQYKYGSSERTPEKSYVALALRFPEQSQWFLDMQLPEHPHFAVIILSDHGDLTTEHPLPEGWLKDEEGFVTARPVHDFPLATDRRVHALQAWAKEKMADAETILANSTLSK